MASKDSGLGQRLRQLREERGLKVREVAKALDTSVGTIGDLESGKAKNARGDTLLALSKFYKVNPAWLQTGEGDREMFARTPAEEDLLSLFRALGDERKDELLEVAQMMKKRDARTDAPVEPQDQPNTQRKH